jgi:dephospho-CoA kinase
VPALGITGSIATGKSVAMVAFEKALSARSFSADDCVRRLLTTDPTVMIEVFRTFGDKLRSSGGVDRALLRDMVFRDSLARAKLEAILHPRVREEWTTLINESRSSVTAPRWLVIEIPLLFETGADAVMDAVVVTACSTCTQMKRLCSVRGILEETAELMIKSQDSQDSKILRSQHMLWTDCPIVRLYEQVRLLSQHLEAVYG